VLTYGGVSLFVVAFSVYPMAVAMFREANLPRRFIPGTIAFGSVTFTMTSAGSPEIQNWIPIKYLGTTPYAGWEVSIVVALFMATAGYLFLQRNLRVAVAGGEGFVARADDPRNDARDLPSPLVSLLPILLVLVVSFALHDSLKESALIVSLGAGVLSGWALNRRFMQGKLGQALALGALGALIAIANTAAVVGFGGVAKLTEGFQAAVEFFTHLPGPPLVGAAIAVTLIAGLTGSASGGQTIALPIIAPHYLDMGVQPDALHRVVAIASGGLDSLPHNGYVVTTIRAICKETYAAAYPAMFHLTATIPLLGAALAVVLFSL
jgi:H+/gluconate symporter-like permease